MLVHLFLDSKQRTLDTTPRFMGEPTLEMLRDIYSCMCWTVVNQRCISPGS
jgi:hypothetical protein